MVQQQRIALPVSGSTPGSGGSPGGGNGDPVQHACLENPMHRGASGAMAHAVTEEPVTASSLNNNRWLLYKLVLVPTVQQ